jgi:hypothetical protein
LKVEADAAQDGKEKDNAPFEALGKETQRAGRFAEQSKKNVFLSKSAQAVENKGWESEK